MQLSVWEKETFYAPADVIIVGGGFVGLWSAYYLKKRKPKLRITIVDRGIIPTGASTRNAGFACFGSATELIRDASSIGESKMLSLVEMRYKGLLRIKKVFGRKKITFSQHPGYELIDPAGLDRYDDLHQQVKWLNKKLSPILHTPDTFVFADDKIKKFGFAGIRHVIKNDLEGSLHPGKLCQALLTKVQSMGVTVLTNINIIKYEENGDKITLSTDKDLQLSGKQLLVCTNGFARQLLPQLEVNPARGQVMVTGPISSLKIKGTFHFDEGFYYFRNIGKRLLLGGARNLALEQEATTEMELTANIQQALESFLSTQLLPGVQYEITDRWSGIMGFGPEKMPIIKEVSANVFCAVRMGGMGVALAPIAAQQVAEMMVKS